MLNDRRLGRFLVDRNFINEIPEAVKAILHGVIILRADISFATDSFVYEGICEDFELANPALESPFYVRDLKDGVVITRKAGFEIAGDNRCLQEFWKQELRERALAQSDDALREAEREPG